MNRAARQKLKLISLLFYASSLQIVLCTIFEGEKSDEERRYEESIKGRLTLARNQLECVDETRVEPDVVLRVRAGNWEVKDDGIKKWAQCIMIRSGVMSKQGVFRMDVALHSIPEDDKEDLENEIDQCIVKSKEPIHEKAWKFIKCFKHLSPRPKHNIF